MRTLVCGWFSLDGGEATAGDLLSMEVVRDLAATMGPVDVATNLGFTDGVDWRLVDPEDYDTLVFVCGPLHRGGIASILDRFPAARTIAANVSVLDQGLADRFDVVIPRDATDRSEPDFALGSSPPTVPVIGVVRAHDQPEYEGSRHGHVHDTIRLVLASRPCATVDFDTRVHPTADPLQAHARTSEEVTSLAGRMDAVVTTRLHGMVLSLGQGTPVVAVDPIAGGAKVTRQARALGWPCVFSPEDAHPEQVAQALTWCLTDDARSKAAACRRRSRDRLGEVLSALRESLDGQR